MVTHELPKLYCNCLYLIENKLFIKIIYKNTHIHAHIYTDFVSNQQGEKMKIYKGFAVPEDKGGPCIVTVNDKLLDPQNRLRNHSPDGFQWGYGGSGPAQLALAICVNAIGEEIGQQVYQDFKWKIIAKLPQGKDWLLTENEVLEAIKSMTE